MQFGERLNVYVIEGSVLVPDPETVLIPLMRQGYHGTPLRQNQYTDWLFLSYQNLDGIQSRWTDPGPTVTIISARR